MTETAERLVNLALFIASRRNPVTAEQCRSAGIGYPDDQDEAAFLRMFERDKDALRAAGLVIEVSHDGDTEAYRLDPAATFARPVALDGAEMATLRTVVIALANDPAFPFADDLALALAKLGVAATAGSAAVADLADSDAPTDGPPVAVLAEAVRTCKRISFGYTNALGEEKSHEVEPYGIFFRDGRWYLAGRDRALDETRTYLTARMRDLEVNPVKPKTPDFERPAGFDIRREERLPFQYGSAVIEAELRFTADVAWRAERLAAGHGALEPLADGSVRWRVEARDLTALAAWTVEHGPGIHAVGPEPLLDALRDGLREVVRAHG